MHDRDCSKVTAVNRSNNRSHKKLHQHRVAENGQGSERGNTFRELQGMDRFISTASKMTYVSFLARWIRACATLDSGDLNHARCGMLEMPTSTGTTTAYRETPRKGHFLPDTSRETADQLAMTWSHDLRNAVGGTLPRRVPPGMIGVPLRAGYRK